MQSQLINILQKRRTLVVNTVLAQLAAYNRVVTSDKREAKLVVEPDYSPLTIYHS